MTMYKNISLDKIQKKKEKRRNTFFFIMYQYDLLSIRRVWRYQRVIKIRKY